MGGRLVLTQIESNGKIRSTKIGTWLLPRINSLDFLNEDYFNEFATKNNLFSEENDYLKQDEYDSSGAVFAPYDYGILVFDFKDQKVFSCNGYSGYLLFGENNVRIDYEHIGSTEQTQVKIINLSGETNYQSIYGDHNLEIRTPRLIESCLRLNGKLFKDGHPFILRDTDDFFTIAARIYGRSLKGVSRREIYEQHENDDAEDFMSHWDKWSNMEVKVPNWEILNGDNSADYIRSAFNYYTMIDVLSDEEKEVWLKYISEIKDSET